MTKRTLAVTVFVALPRLSSANPEIRWHTVDGGGEVSSAGSLRLSGTIGQADTGIMSAGTIEVSAGYWSTGAPAACATDGSISLLHISAFEHCLTGPVLGVAPGCDCLDLDQSGSVDLSDFAEAQLQFGGA